MNPTALLLGYALLQGADIATTTYGLRQPGLYEGNPAIAWCMAEFGDLWWVPKIALVVCSVLIAQRLRSWWPINLIFALTLAAVLNNIARAI